MNNCRRPANSTEKCIPVYSVAWYKNHPRLAKMSEGQFSDIIEDCLAYGADLENIYFENAPLNQTALILGEIINPKMDNVVIDIKQDVVYISKRQGIAYVTAEGSRGFLIKRVPGSFLFDVVYRAVSSIQNTYLEVVGDNPTIVQSGLLVQADGRLDQVANYVEEALNVLD